MMNRFSLALVTGASSGIGEAVARLLADKGIPLIIHGRNKEQLEKLAAELTLKVCVDILIGDLADREGRDQVIKVINDRMPDLVINNAGFGLFGDVLTYPTADEMRILEVDGNATVELTIEAARCLVSQDKKGVIMNIGSSGGEIPIGPGYTLYSSTKAMINYFSQSFDQEIREYGVRVLVSAPGLIDTNFRERAGGYQERSFYTKFVMTSEFAAQQIWRQIEKGKPIHVFGWQTRFFVFLTKYLLPKRLTGWMVHRHIQQRTKKREIIKSKYER
jgi:short-subunit dehydrogenase